MAYADLRDYLATLDRSGKLLRVQAEVERDWEIAAVTRRVFQRIPEKDRPGLVFDHVKGSDIPVTVGILGASREVTDVHFLHAGGGAAFLAIAMRKKFDGQPLAAMWGAWSVDPSLSKFTVVVDDDIDVRDTFQVLWAMSWHVQPQRDVQIIQQTPPVPLDPSLAPADMARAVRRGQLASKVGIDATRKHAYPARSVPPREHLEEVDRRWERYGLDPQYLASMAGAR